jgi:hypothetical protein
MKSSGYFSLLIACLFSLSLSAQTKTKPPVKPKKVDRTLIQFSGVVVENDSLRPIANTSIFAKNTYHGTMSDFFGYFSFVAQVGDTIEFTALGFKTHIFTIPDTLHSTKYSLVQMMRRDTFLLKDVVIYPWPSKEQFKDAFIRTPVPDNDLDRARRNLDAGQMAARAAAMPNDGSMNYKTTLQQQYSRLYYAGQLPPNNLLNPIAWYKFVEAWKRGDFKNKPATPATQDPGLDQDH